MCAEIGSLQSKPAIGSARLVYDESGRAQPFAFDAAFYAQLTAWLKDWQKRSGLPAADQIRTLGSWIDGSSQGCSSYHHAARAFDFTRLSRKGGVQVSGRYDVWGKYPAPRRRFWELRFWALAASLHEHFAYVVTYRKNEGHYNHIHIDNGGSGSQPAPFRTHWSTQAEAIQAICPIVWQVECPASGQWDDATDRASRTVLQRIGVGGGLGEATKKGATRWQLFLRATTKRALQLARAAGSG